MQEDGAQPTNLERLQGHLKKDSLAEKLVAARIAAEAADPRPSLREVIQGRLEELKRKHEPVSD